MRRLTGVVSHEHVARLQRNCSANDQAVSHTLVQEAPRVHHRAHDGRAIHTLSVLDEFTRESLAIRTEKQLVGLT